MEALGINLGYLITFTLSFGILFVVLRAWVYKPLLAQLEKRRLAIAKASKMRAWQPMRGQMQRKKQPHHYRCTNPIG